MRSFGSGLCRRRLGRSGEVVIGLIGIAPRIIEPAHLGEEHGFHLGKFAGVSWIAGEIRRQTGGIEGRIRRILRAITRHDGEARAGG